MHAYHVRGFLYTLPLLSPTRFSVPEDSLNFPGSPPLFSSHFVSLESVNVRKYMIFSWFISLFYFLFYFSKCLITSPLNLYHSFSFSIHLPMDIWDDSETCLL